MKKLSLLLFASILFLSCSEDEPEVAQREAPTLNIGNFSYDIGTIASTSVIVEFTSNPVTSSGGELIQEIWFRKSSDTEWSILDITDVAFQQLYLLDGLDLATKYIIKPVFTIGELVKEGPERTLTTLPFEYTALKDGFEQILLLSNDTSIDFQAFESEPSFYLKYANDSIPMIYDAISKDSLLISFQADNSLFFEGNDANVEKINTSISFQFKEYYEKDWKGLEIFNRQPKIDSLIFQEVVSCTDLDHTKLQFTGLFWNATLFSESLLEADEYAISIKNVQDPSIATPVYIKSDFIENIATGCEAGIDIIFEEPIQNRFHSGSLLWISFPKDLLPEGDYQLQFSAIKNNETYTAEPFEFELSYQ